MKLLLSLFQIELPSRTVMQDSYLMAALEQQVRPTCACNITLNLAMSLRSMLRTRSLSIECRVDEFTQDQAGIITWITSPQLPMGWMMRPASPSFKEKMIYLRR